MARDPAARAARIAHRQQMNSLENATGIGCGLLLILGAVFSLHQCTKEAPRTEQELQAEAQRAARDREKGFHCLSAWDGSNASFVRQVKAGLRNPESFEHLDTLITPVNEETGKHGISMTFRAENGFGGLNLGRAIGEVDPTTCDASNIVVDG